MIRPKQRTAPYNDTQQEEEPGINNNPDAIVAASYLWNNGMVISYDAKGNQLPHLQGRFTQELKDKILEHSNKDTKLNGFTGNPGIWNHKTIPHK